MLQLRPRPSLQKTRRGGSGRRLQIFRPRLHFSLKILLPRLHLSLRVWRTGSRNDPGKGLPSGSNIQMSAVPLPGEAEERLLRQLFMKEQERRIQEALSLGIHLRAAEGEPLPLLSHVHGRPSNVEDIYDSLSQALTIRDRSF